MNVLALNCFKLTFNPGSLVVKADRNAAKMLGCSDNITRARFMINPLYIQENPQMMFSPHKFVSSIKKAVQVMKTAEANGLYRDISNELL